MYIPTPSRRPIQISFMTLPKHTVLGSSSQSMTASHCHTLPLCWNATFHVALVGHVARANPHWRGLTANRFSPSSGPYARFS